MKKTMKKVEFNVKITYYMAQLVIKKVRIKRICIVLITLLSAYFMYTLYALYSCMSNKELCIKELKFDYAKPNNFEINAKIINSKTPFQFCIKNMKTKVSIFNATLFTIKSKNIEFEQNRDIKLKDELDIEYNSKYKFGLLKDIKNAKEVEFKISCTIRYSIFGIPVVIPIKKTQKMKQEGTEPFINILSHNVLVDSAPLAVETKLKISQEYYNIILPNLTFRIKINKNAFAIVKLISYTDERMYMFNITIHDHKAFSSSLPLLLDSNIFSMTFSDFEFPNSKNATFNNILENCIKSGEVKASGNKMKSGNDVSIWFTKLCPGIDFKIGNVENETVNGSLNIHRTIIDNFIPTHLFLNKVLLPSVSIKGSLVNKQKGNNNENISIGTIHMNNRIETLSDYFLFDYSVKITDLNALLNQIIEPKMYLKLQVFGNNYFEKMIDEIFFLWNFRETFTFTAQNYLNERKTKSKILNNKALNVYDLNVEMKDEKSESFCIDKTLKLPKYIKKDEHFSLSWNDVRFKLSNQTVEIVVCIEKGGVLFIKNFEHISEIFKAEKVLKSSYKITKTNDEWTNFVGVNENEENKRFNINFNYHTNNNADVPLSLYYNVKKRDKPTLSRILSRFNVKLGKIQSISDFQLVFNSHPVQIQNEYFSLNCNIKTLETVFCLKGSNKNDNEYFSYITLPKLSLNFTLSKDTLHGISFKCQRKDSVVLNVKLFWEYLEMFDQINFVPIKRMHYFSYFTNSFLSTFIFRRPSTKSINLKNRNLQKITNFTDENLILNCDAVFDGYIKGNCDLKFPVSSINHSPMVISNFSWESIEIMIVGTKKKEISMSVVRLNKGSIGLRVEETQDNSDTTNGYYQTNDCLSVSFCVSKNILDGKTYEIYINQPKKNDKYVNDKYINKNYMNEIYMNEMPNNKYKITKTRDEIIKILKLNNNESSMYLTDNKFTFSKTSANLNFNIHTKEHLIDKFSAILGNVLNRIQLVSYPKNIEVKMNVLCDIKSNAILKQSRIQAKLKEKVKIIYPYDVQTQIINNICPILTINFDYKFSKYVNLRHIKKTQSEVDKMTKLKNNITNVNTWLAIFPRFFVNLWSYKLQIKRDNKRNYIKAGIEINAPIYFDEMYEMQIIVDDQLICYMNVKENEIIENKNTWIFLNVFTDIREKNGDRTVYIRMNKGDGKIIEYKIVIEDETFYYLLFLGIENAYNQIYEYADYKVRNMDLETIYNGVKYVAKSLWNYVKG
ncbi:hypothetical protein BDAP_001752 [Binucleata daphniae]